MKMFVWWSFSKRKDSSGLSCTNTHSHPLKPAGSHKTQDTAFSLPVWCRRRWTPRSRPPRWLSAGTAGILRCCHRRSFPTWRPWRCWWSCRRSGWCQTPPLPRLCQQFPDKKQRGTVRSWFMTLDGNSKLIGRETWRLACLKDDYVLLIFSFIFLSTNSVWRMKNQQWIDPDT